MSFYFCHFHCEYRIFCRQKKTVTPSHISFARHTLVLLEKIQLQFLPILVHCSFLVLFFCVFASFSKMCVIWILMVPLRLINIKIRVISCSKWFHCLLLRKFYEIPIEGNREIYGCNATTSNEKHIFSDDEKKNNRIEKKKIKKRKKITHIKTRFIWLFYRTVSNAL